MPKLKVVKLMSGITLGGSEPLSGCLPRLARVAIWAEGGDDPSFMKLLTGLLLEVIPREKQSWPRLLDGKRDAVCILKTT